MSKLLYQKAGVYAMWLNGVVGVSYEVNYAKWVESCMSLFFWDINQPTLPRFPLIPLYGFQSGLFGFEGRFLDRLATKSTQTSIGLIAKLQEAHWAMGLVRCVPMETRPQDSKDTSHCRHQTSSFSNLGDILIGLRQRAICLQILMRIGCFY